MKKFSTHAWIQLNKETYLNLLMVMAPVLNFLSGLTLSLYTASLPNIASYFHGSAEMVKNTVTFSILGFGIGSVLLGAALDTLGRRIVLLLALSIYVIASISALFATNIHEVILICFIQGMMSASVSIGPRALISDHFTGHRFQIGLLYTSLAYGLGAVVGPFLGGLLQYHFGWQANFMAYAIFSSVLLLMVVLYIHESLPPQPTFSWKTLLMDHVIMLRKWPFMMGGLLCACCQFELMVYPTVGAFLVERVLHHSALAYGDSALLISVGYLAGSLVNRALVKKMDLHWRTWLGFALLIVGLLLQLVFFFVGTLSLVTVTVPIIVIAFANGFIFMNVLAPSVKMFSQKPGIAIALLTCLTMLISALGLFVISYFTVESLLAIGLLFLVPAAIQLLVYGVCRAEMKL